MSMRRMQPVPPRQTREPSLPGRSRRIEPPAGLPLVVRTARALAIGSMLGTSMLGASLIGVGAAPADGTTRAADTPPVGAVALRLAGAGGGTSQGLAIVGDRTYVGVGTHVEVLARPPDGRFERVGVVDVGAGVTAVAAGGGALWAGGTDGAVRRFDLADGDQPVLTDRLDLMPVDGAGSITDTSAVAALAIGNGRVFAALSDHGLAVIDLTGGGPPRLAARLMAPGLVTDVAALGTVGYAVDGQRGLVIVDASNADRPVEGAVVPLRMAASAPGVRGVTGPVAVDAAGRRLAVTVCDGPCGFRPSTAALITFDLDDPLAPREVGRVATEYTVANDLVVTPGGAYVAITQCGPRCWSQVLAFDRAPDGTLVARDTPSTWQSVHRYPQAIAVDASGDVIVAQRGGGVIALSEAEPYTVAEWTYASDPVAVAFDAGRMLVFDAEATSLRMIDVGARGGPRPKGTWSPDDADDAVVGEWAFDFGTGTTAVALGPRLAVMADGHAGALVFDAADPRRLSLIARAPLPSASAVLLRQTDAFIGTSGYESEGVPATLTHVDLSRPSAPTFAAPVPVGSKAVAGLHQVGDTLWVLLCGTSWGIRGFDVRQPSAPLALAPETVLDEVGRPVMAAGRLAIGVGGAEGSGDSQGNGDNQAVDVYDLASPHAPRLIARLPDAGHVLGLWDDLVYTARTGAVDVYRVSSDGSGSGSGDGPTLQTPARIATLAVPDYAPTAFNPGWVDEAGRVVLNGWGGGWTVLETVRVGLGVRVVVPVAFRP